MAKYRRIPKEIEAIQFKAEKYWDYVDNKESMNGEERFLNYVEFNGHLESRKGSFRLDPKEKGGLMYGSTIEDGDYIIIHEDSSIFIVAENAFKEVYEEVQ